MGGWMRQIDIDRQFSLKILCNRVLPKETMKAGEEGEVVRNISIVQCEQNHFTYYQIILGKALNVSLVNVLDDSFPLFPKVRSKESL